MASVDSKVEAEPRYKKGDTLIYEDNTNVTVVDVHFDKEEHFYTIRMPDGSERQTLESKLTREEDDEEAEEELLDVDENDKVTGDIKHGNISISRTNKSTAAEAHLISVSVKLSFDLEPVKALDSDGIWLRLQARPNQTVRWLKQQIWYHSNDYKMVPSIQTLWCMGAEDDKSGLARERKLVSTFPKTDDIEDGNLIQLRGFVLKCFLEKGAKKGSQDEPGLVIKALDTSGKIKILTASHPVFELMIGASPSSVLLKELPQLRDPLSKWTGTKRYMLGITKQEDRMVLDSLSVDSEFDKAEYERAKAKANLQPDFTMLQDLEVGDKVELNGFMLNSFLEESAEMGYDLMVKVLDTSGISKVLSASEQVCEMMTGISVSEIAQERMQDIETRLSTWTDAKAYVMTVIKKEGYLELESLAAKDIITENSAFGRAEYERAKGRANLQPDFTMISDLEVEDRAELKGFVLNSFLEDSGEGGFDLVVEVLDASGVSKVLSASEKVCRMMTGTSESKITSERMQEIKTRLSTWIDAKAYVMEVTKKEGYIQLESLAVPPDDQSDHKSQQQKNKKNAELCDFSVDRLVEMRDNCSLSMYGLGHDSIIYLSNTKSDLGFVPMPEHRKLMVATRIHYDNTCGLPDLERLKRMLTVSCAYADYVAVAVMAKGEKGNILVEKVRKISAQFGNTVVIPIHVWGHYVPALNSLLHCAIEHKCSLIQYQSADVRASKRVSNLLVDSVRGNTLVAGAALIGHEFKPGLQELTGNTSPWNTLAVWDVQKLSYTGFLAISDGNVDGVEPGIEEVAVVTLLQALHKHSSMAKLLNISVELGLRWDVEFPEDSTREEYHRKKMASKMRRASLQLKALGLAAGVVRHLKCPAGPLD